MDMFHKIWHTLKHKGDISPLCGLDAEYTKGNVAKSIENTTSNPYTQNLTLNALEFLLARAAGQLSHLLVSFLQVSYKYETIWKDLEPLHWKSAHGFIWVKVELKPLVQW